MDIFEISKTDIKFPQRLLEIKQCPQKLYVCGNIELLNTNFTLGIVGSRNCTEYGRSCADYFGRECSQKEICIISGLAIGIDASSHISSIDEKGKTIAVIGSGFNNIYPKQNEWLFHKILENGGSIISEYEPDVEAVSSNFPKRNRIISGMSDAILVVEAGYRSGATITAGFSKQFGKKVFCIPSNIFSKNGIGTNNLIKQGAILVTSPEEIILQMDKYTQRNNINAQTSDNTKNQIVEIPEKYEQIYEIILSGTNHINDICRTIKQSISQIVPVLTMMELEGYIEQISTSEYKIKNK